MDWGKPIALVSGFCVAALALSLTAGAPAWAASQQSWNECSGSDPARSIPACAEIIADQGETAANRADAYLFRAAAFLVRGNLDSAIADYTKAIELAPRNIVAYAGRAVAHLHKGERDKAIMDYAIARRIDPARLATFAAGNPELAEIGKLASAAPVPPLPAEHAVEDRITAEILVRELRAMGLPATTDQDESGDPRVTSSLEGYKWQMYFYDCDKTGASDQRRCRSFQFFIDNITPRPVPMSTIVRWNGTMSHAKAYLQQGNDSGCKAQASCAARIEIDVLTADTGADPAQTFRTYFAIFKQRARQFRSAIGAN